MNTENQKTKEKITNYALKFQMEASSFQKMAILHEYINFIGTNKLLKDLFVNENKNIGKLVKEFSKDKISIDNFKSMFKDLGFLKEGMNIKDCSTDVLDLSGSIFRSLAIMSCAMEEYKKADNERRKKLESNFKEAFSDPIKVNAINMQITLLNTKLFDVLNKENFLNKEEVKDKLYFDKEKSILHFKGKKIRIKRKADFPLEHYILEYMFSQEDRSEEVYFRDIAEEKLNENDYDGVNDWKKYYRACERLQEKIRKETGIDDFLIFTTGKTANVIINKKYIPQ